ncbi:DUF4173 domain-containing protein [Rubellicoccus peritrichatus]|uniref:DUF4173 domain-containing protein n=1 Tax=Rubellicoccus peritrichatus TaxID=3080537 RepID=A0AAQ3QVN9_9BACT|nr:DUF4173 domain-containing protein [Puniceicoccus sp. CR14]WOO41823.1 DUF4173 domain-containing protein [Puniceicoccus sp. CR14]
MNDSSPALPPALSTVPSTTLPRAGIGLLAAVVIGDWLFWGHLFGINFGLYILVLVGLVYLNRPDYRVSKFDWCFVGLLIIAAIQTGLRSSLSNSLVLVALLLVVSAHTFYGQLSPVWARWIQGMLGAFKFAVSIAQFFRLLKKSTANAPRINEKLHRVWSVSWLALVLVVLFALILKSGNALLAERLEGMFDAFLEFFLGLTLPSPMHILFWILLSILALVLMLPGRIEFKSKRWFSEFPEIPVSAENCSLAVIRSIIALVAVNILFLLTNSLDVSHLWFSQSLPAGIGFSQYVHEGVGSLNLAVVLSAIVLTLVFQQGGDVSKSKWIKLLALIWIIQNLFLVLGVYLRLKLYIDAHWLTPKRVYVGIFLLLVVTGYILLGWHIFKSRSVKRLLFRNAFAVCALFYLIQLVNVPALVADYNFAQWKQTPEHFIGRDFQPVLGLEVVPLMIKVADSGLENASVDEARAILDEIYFLERRQMRKSSWQSWEYREAKIRRMLFQYHENSRAKALQ